VKRVLSFLVRKLGTDDEDLLDRAIGKFKQERALAPERFLADSRTHAFVATQEGSGEIAGYAYGYEVFRPEGRRMILLYDLEVEQKAKEAGAGKELVRAFRELAESRGLEHMWLYAYADNPGVKGLYEEMGIRVTGHPDTGYWWVFE
jgi:ribosomal protein S18 acetylase RimI-like enzyme